MLSSLNFSAVEFGVVLVEANGLDRSKDDKVRTLLGRHGYDFLETTSGNDWFLNKHFRSIYAEANKPRVP